MVFKFDDGDGGGGYTYFWCGRPRKKNIPKQLTTQKNDWIESCSICIIIEPVDLMVETEKMMPREPHNNNIDVNAFFVIRRRLCDIY